MQKDRREPSALSTPSSGRLVSIPLARILADPPARSGELDTDVAVAVDRIR
ncbi:MAG: hypothetical protein ACTHMH_15045 [Curtobacterium sp.]